MTRGNRVFQQNRPGADIARYVFRPDSRFRINCITHGVHNLWRAVASLLRVNSGDTLDLDPGPKVLYSRPAADRLFQSAAKFFGPRVIGVVLTGGDSDGTKGLESIKASGGIAIVQSPAEAVNPEMPMSALDNVFVDDVLPLSEIGPLLVELTRPDNMSAL